MTHIYSLPITLKGNPYLEHLYAAINDQGGYTVHPFNLRAIFGSLLRRHKTIVHMHWESNLFGSAYFLVSVARMAYRFPLLFLARALGAKIVWTMHNLGNHDAVHPVLDRFGVKLIWILAQGVIVQNKRIAGEMQKLHPRTKVAYIPIGTFKLYGEAQPEARAEQRAQWGAKDGELVLLSLGLIRPYKQPEVLIDAVRKAEGVRLVIAGKGDKDYIESLRAYAKDAPVVIHGEFVPDEKIAPYYAASDYAIFAYGGSSMTSAAVILGFAYGVPAIMFKMPLPAEELLKPGCGFAVETDEELKELFEKLATLPKPTPEFVEASIAELGWGRVGRDVRALYTSI